MSDRLEIARPRLTPSRVAKYGLHLAALGCAFLVAYEIRRALPLAWWFEHEDAVRVLGWAALYALIGGAVEAVFQTERAAWRFVSLREMLAIVRNIIVSTALFILVIFTVDRGLELPRSVVVLAGLFSIVFLGGLRVLWRFLHDPALLKGLLPFSPPQRAATRKPLVVVGSMAAAEPQIRQLISDPATTYRPVGVITPHLSEVGLRLHDVPFVQQLGPDTFKDRNPKNAATANEPYALLFLGDPVRDFGFSVERIGELRQRGHVLLRPQTLTELGLDLGAKQALREIPLEEFLPRQPIRLNPGPVRDLIRGRRVLVTGAGGSIGSEIARQLTTMGCAHLTLVDHSEFLLFEIDRELARLAPDASRQAILANVRDQKRIDDVFHDEKPEIVFHAAALKHVALVENNPAEGVLTNVLGTWNVLRAAIGSDAAQFVLISTDKAVAPTNVMGATKRISESLLSLYPETKTRLSAVRFGNVLGSAGSVVPIFRDQIARGGPVTVTHPDVNRYFMTIPEAVQLVLHSTAINAARDTPGPSKFLLEMGEPVRIVDLARQMIELAGKTPERDVVIQFTGLKPGEKLSEALFDEDEEVRETAEGIMEFNSKGYGRLTKAEVEDLINKSRSALSLDVRRTVMNSAQTLRSDSPGARV